MMRPRFRVTGVRFGFPEYSGNLAELYKTFVKGEPSTLPEPPIQYAEFAAWQRRWAQGRELDRQLACWKRHIHGARTMLEFPTDGARLKDLGVNFVMIHWNPNHPDAQAYHRKLVKFAVEEIEADLIHFDNCCLAGRD